MLILALDSSAAPASAALLEDGKILSGFYINTKQTHSQTLMPMVESVLKLTNKTLDDVTCMAVSAGPGAKIFIRKTRGDGVTVAAAMQDWRISFE